MTRGAMNLAGLATLIGRESTLSAAIADGQAGLSALDLTAPPALRPFLAATLTSPPEGPGRTVLVVTATAREAEDLTDALADLHSPSEVAYYPAWETLPHERLSPRSDTVGRRLAVLRRLGPGRPRLAPGRFGSWSPRSGRCCSRRLRAWPTSSRSNSPSATRSRWRT